MSHVLLGLSLHIGMREFGFTIATTYIQIKYGKKYGWLTLLTPFNRYSKLYWRKYV